MKIDKSLMKDDKGRYLVQGLFLEDRYNPDMAIFTFDGEDKLYKGKTFISLKKRYLETADPVEYEFANTWLYDWDHWKRMCANKLLATHIDKWREELKLSLMSEGVLNLIELASEGKSYQAAKWLADAGWDVQKRGRPSNEEIEGHIKKRAEEMEEWSEGAELLRLVKKDK